MEGIIDPLPSSADLVNAGYLACCTHEVLRILRLSERREPFGQAFAVEVAGSKLPTLLRCGLALPPEMGFLLGPGGAPRVVEERPAV